MDTFILYIEIGGIIYYNIDTKQHKHYIGGSGDVFEHKTFIFCLQH